jgi:hypothetical protein
MTSTLTDKDGLDPVYRDALTRALEMARREPLRGDQLDYKLKHEPWEQVARFAAYCCQCDNLHLGPHQSPPCWATEADLVADPNDLEDIYGRRAAAVLRKRLLDAGLLAHEPDPITALERAKRTEEVDDAKQPSPEL